LFIFQINTTTNNNNNNNNITTSTGDSTKPTNFIMKNSNPALNRCSKTQLYFESISRALEMTSCKVVPFFGTFLHDFTQILDGVPSQKGAEFQYKTGP
jgi:hypothetical protein